MSPVKHPDWLHIIGPTFRAVVELDHRGTAYRCSTIVGFLRGRSLADVRAYAEDRRWTLTEHSGDAPD